MDSLRLILLGLGLLLIGGMLVYYGRQRESGSKLPGRSGSRVHRWLHERLRSLPRPRWPSRRRASTRAMDAVPEPLYADEPDAEDIAALSGLRVPVGEPQLDLEALGPISALQAEDHPAAETLIVVLNVMAHAGRKFHGLDILNALREQDMLFGAMNIFHAYPPDSEIRQPVCSLANTVEPGTFDIEHMAELETPGLTLFLQLPGPRSGREAFEQMLRIGRGLAEQLDGELCDETRSALTLQTIGHLKETIEAHDFKQKMAAIKNQRR